MGERAKAGMSGSFVLNLEAEWGFGKTFFMTRFAEQLSASGHPVVFIDAWKNDFSDDPYTNVVAEIERYFQQFLDEARATEGGFVKAYDAVKKNVGKIFWIGLKGGLKRGSRWLIAEGADEIVEVVDKHVVDTGEVGEKIGSDMEEQTIKVTDAIIDAFAEKRIKDFEEAKVSLDRFRESLARLLLELEEQTGKKLPFYVLIDELDRCRPTYAIAMLERIKHLFDVDNVVFLVSTDTQQLAHSINGVYGQGFDSRRYLQRFFSRSYVLPKPTPRALIDSILDSSGTNESKWQAPGIENDNRGFLAEASTRYGMSIRETQQAVDILQSLTTVWSHNSPIQLLVMYPLIFGFLSGKDITDLTSAGWLYRSANPILHDWTVIDQGVFSGFKKFRQTNRISDYLRSLLDAVSGSMRAYLDINPDRYNAQEVPNYIDLWVEDLQSREYNLRFSNAVRKEEVSLIRSYPDYIRHAGRISV